MSCFEILVALELGLIYAVAAIGIFLTYQVINVSDLTCDGSFVLGAASSTILMKNGYNPWLCLGVGLLAGAAAGLVTACLSVYGKLTPLLSGILVAFMLYSVNLRVMNNVPNITIFGLTNIFSHYNSILILGFVVFILWTATSYLLQTDLGLSLQCLGQNLTLAKLLGMRVSVLTIFVLVLSNGLIGLSGALLSQYQGYVDISQGLGTIITGLSAVIIGQKIIGNNFMPLRLIACVVGSMVYRFLISLALHTSWLGLQTQDVNLVAGIFLIMVLLIQRTKQSC